MSIRPRGGNWQILALFGLTNFVIALFLFLHGARRIPSAEAALIGTLEIVLSPIWVWAIFAERPTNAALAGGEAIFGAVLWHTIGDRQNADGDGPRPSGRTGSARLSNA